MDNGEIVDGFEGLDYCTIIGRDPKLFLWHVDNVLRNAGLHRSQWKFHTIVYSSRSIPQSTTYEILKICDAKGILVHQINENEDVPFLYRLYNCWNICQEVGKNPFTIRAGSDQAFSPKSFLNAAKAIKSLNGKSAVLNFQTIESELGAQYNSRHLCKAFGVTPDNFKENDFNEYAASISRTGLFDAHTALKEWGAPGVFNSSLGAGWKRTDGASFVFSRELWKAFGPMKPIDHRGFTGDVTIMDRIEQAGIPNYIIGDAITYHLIRGESKGHGQ